ncbi:hypothetical protein E5206_00050 [Arthrobacter sp. PAMC25564]|uniref:multidrug efflux MFS transporter n=1 Tax=Arthrobacter sp. PAMC25564 TaxID=2565366 RepID=UPI0010A2A244|nr:multidrug efflux MFS transporter [Arthrobacter sp. PAMC25564]QCB95522.1 hypothetical protein E5206_00050 [Arthrobacter sp. PAMC25564]
MLVERSRARARKPVLLDLTLLDIRSFRYGSIAALVVALGKFGMLFALPLFLRGALGYTALDTGLLILSLAVGTFLISGVQPSSPVDSAVAASCARACSSRPSPSPGWAPRHTPSGSS